jgi:hypothetical protein
MTPQQIAEEVVTAMSGKTINSAEQWQEELRREVLAAVKSYGIYCYDQVLKELPYYKNDSGVKELEDYKNYISVDDVEHLRKYLLYK